ncbi:MAG: PA domain-containing protein [Methylococcales bacterium]
MTVNFPQILKGAGLSLILFGSGLSVVHAAATITIINGDLAGEGFNDPTVVAPVGGNNATTLGQQRLNVFQAAADIWGAQLDSAVPIRIFASMDALTCTASSALLGSAGPITVFRDFSGAAYSGTWYHPALANRLAGFDLDPTVDDIIARFNVDLGKPDCFDGISFYLGLDNNHGNNIDLVTVLLHEFSHGLGFLTVTDGSTGQTLGNYGFPALWDHYIFDNTQALSWSAMTDSERQASAINTGELTWLGVAVQESLADVLAPVPQLTINGPVSVAGVYTVGEAEFGPKVVSPGVTGQLMPVVDTFGRLGFACSKFSPINALSVKGNIALIDRGGLCGFQTKVKNAQNAGAIGVIIADNLSTSTPPTMTGSDASITIPSVSITKLAGVTLKNALRFRSRTKSGVIANLSLSDARFAGTDTYGKALLYAPNPFITGSSVSHWDPGMTPNQLMEPSFNVDLTHSVASPQDLTLRLLKDLGW